MTPHTALLAREVRLSGQPMSGTAVETSRSKEYDGETEQDSTGTEAEA